MIAKHTKKGATREGDESMPRVKKRAAGAAEASAVEDAASLLLDDDFAVRTKRMRVAGGRGRRSRRRGRRRSWGPPLRARCRAADQGASRRRHGDYALPPLSLLDAPPPGRRIDKSRLFDNARLLEAKCREFGRGASRRSIPGPVVTTYEFKPDAGVKYSKVVGLADDLGLALEAESIRIDRMSGRATVGIEIPNEKRETDLAARDARVRRVPALGVAS